MKENDTEIFDLSHIRLLLVDDEDEYREAISRRLIKRGITASHAENGDDCLDFLKKNQVDVIVMDVKMPGMTGIETLKKLKKQYEKTEVILLTGQAAICDGVEGIKSGAFDYLSKPVEIEHLMIKVKQAYEKITLEREKEKEKTLRAKCERQMMDSERLVALGRLSTGVAHEINNPLAIINEAAGLMRLLLNRKTPEGEFPIKEIELTLEKIETGVDRAKKITHQLLGFAKNQVPEFIETDLNVLLDETINLLQTAIEEKKIEIVNQAASDGVIVWSDPYQIRQILINIITNAIYATPEKGVIKANILDRRDSVVLEFEDNGSGIPKENIGRIFDPFFTTKPADKGTGLGLFVVRRIISNLKGDIDVESDFGRGTKFTITLPKFAEGAEKPKGTKNIFSKVLHKIKEKTDDDKNTGKSTSSRR